MIFFSVSDFVPRPSMPGISPSSSTESIWLYQEKPQYERTCDGCQQLLRWHRSTNAKGQYLGRWYTTVCSVLPARHQYAYLVQCPTAAPGCARFKWAPGSAHDVARVSKSLSQSPDPAGTDGNGVQPAVVPTESSNQVCNIHILDVI